MILYQCFFVTTPITLTFRTSSSSFSVHRSVMPVRLEFDEMLPELLLFGLLNRNLFTYSHLVISFLPSSHNYKHYFCRSLSNNFIICLLIWLISNWSLFINLPLLRNPIRVQTAQTETYLRQLSFFWLLFVAGLQKIVANIYAVTRVYV